jgi:WD40 repeat protein
VNTPTLRAPIFVSFTLLITDLWLCCAVLRSINCVDITRDASVVAGGYADSSIKVWDLQKDHQRIFGTGKEEAPTSRKRSTDYVQLLGHSGPVYACSFSPDNQYLISASEDNTGTLPSCRVCVVCVWCACRVVSCRVCLTCGFMGTSAPVESRDSNEPRLLSGTQLPRVGCRV